MSMSMIEGTHEAEAGWTDFPCEGRCGDMVTEDNGHPDYDDLCLECGERKDAEKHEEAALEALETYRTVRRAYHNLMLIRLSCITSWERIEYEMRRDIATKECRRYIAEVRRLRRMQ